MVKKDGEVAEKEARESAAFDDPLAGSGSSSSPSTNREKQEREKKQKMEGQYGEEAAEKEEAKALKMRYAKAIEEARECFIAEIIAEKKLVAGPEMKFKQYDENDSVFGIEFPKWGLTGLKGDAIWRGASHSPFPDGAAPSSGDVQEKVKNEDMPEESTEG